MTEERGVTLIRVTPRKARNISCSYVLKYLSGRFLKVLRRALLRGLLRLFFRELFGFLFRFFRLFPLENAAELASELESLENACIRSERKRIVHRAMEKLEPRHYRVLWLRYFDDMTSREAAKVMGISTHAAEALASRARSALRTLLEKEGYTDENLF